MLRFVDEWTARVAAMAKQMLDNYSKRLSGISKQKTLTFEVVSEPRERFPITLSTQIQSFISYLVD